MSSVYIENTNSIYSQKSVSVPFIGDFSSEKDIDSALELMAAGAPLALDNDLVWAIWGDGANDKFVNELMRVKGREAGKAISLTVPFERLVLFADATVVHPSVRPLLEDSECNKLKSLLSAISFVRFPGNQSLIEASDLPECVKSYNTEDNSPILQTYDPVGKDDIETFLKKADKLGIKYPCASSLNYAKQKEIINTDDAMSFISHKDRQLPLLSCRMADGISRAKAKGSFPIVQFDSTGISIVREGSIGNDIIQQLLVDYGLITLAPTYRPAHYQDKVLHLKDLPKDVRGLKGGSLADALRTYLGWKSNCTA